MSLLMKALEKAAKDRGDARPEPAPAPAATAAASAAPAPASSSAPVRSELSLEPMGTEPPATTRVEPAPRGGAIPARPPAAPAPTAAAAPARERAQAATVLQASAGRASASAGGMGEYLRAHPVVVLGTIAGLFALAFGGYVYVQIFNPGLLTGRPAIAPKGNIPSQGQAPAPKSEPIPSAALLKDPPAEAAPPAPGEAGRAKPQLPALPQQQAEDPARGGNAIVVSPGSPDPVLNPLLGEAYAALQANQLEAARGLYQKLLAAEPKNVDGLLALASIAARQGNESEATRLYLQVLDLDPRNALAQSGLIALIGRADPLAAESRLRQLIAREPSAHLYFTLGNLYADQSQWAAAQQAYFQAHHLDPANPDYAYNLAVGLEHVSQPRLALGFYRRAAQLAATRGRSNFDPTAVQQRISRLAQQVE